MVLLFVLLGVAIDRGVMRNSTTTFAFLSFSWSGILGELYFKFRPFLRIYIFDFPGSQQQCTLC